MIGLMILGVVFLYILLAKFIINRVYKIYKSKKAKNIALVIMILIPTWDIILGFPIYAYLCMFESGTKIYKTVDNAEGFYVGERGIQNEPHEPYDGYKYIEYKEMRYSKSTGKYYRSYWVDYYKDRDASNLCVYPKYPNSLSHPYTKVFNEGRCIVKEEISESEVSGLWKVSKKIIKDYYILYLRIRYSEVEVIDPRTKKKYFTVEGYLIDKSWVTGILNISSGSKGKLGCNNYINWDNSISSTSIIYTINKTLQGER